MRLSSRAISRASLLGVSLLLFACIPAPAPEIEWVTAPVNQAQEGADSRAKIKKGDVVRVIIKEGKKKDVFDVHEVEEAAFLGVSRIDHRTYRVHYSALQSMEVRRWAIGWTVIGPTDIGPAN